MTPPVPQQIRGWIDDIARHDRQYGDLDGHDWAEEDFPDTTDPYELDALMLETQRMIRAARYIEARVKAAFQENIDREGAIRIGGTVYATKPNRKRVLQDPDGLVDFLGDQWRAAVRVSTSNVRITAVKGIAHDRGIDAQAVEDTFFAWEGDDDRMLTATPISRAPKWGQALNEGERRQT